MNYLIKIKINPNRVNQSYRHLSKYVIKSKYEMPWNSPDKKELSMSLPEFLLNNGPLNDKVAIIDGSSPEKKLSYNQLYQTTYSFAISLNKLGVKENDIVGILSPNNINYFTVFHGIGLSGAASTPINPTYTEEEILYQLTSTNAKALIFHPMCSAKAIPIINKLNIIGIALVKDNSLSELSISNKMHLHFVDDLINEKINLNSLKKIDSNSLMTIPFSSGTTGKPKGVMLTHKNLISNVLQTMPLEGKYLVPDANQPDGGITLVPLPFFHIYGMMVGLMVPIYARGKTIFMPSFDLKVYLKTIETFKVTRSAIVPPIILELAKNPIVSEYDLSSLKSILSGAAPLGAEIQKACALRLGCIVKQGWGMTEISPCGAITPDELVRDMDYIKGKAGVLPPDTEAKIISPITGEDIDPIEEGEVMIRGPQVMRGYFNNPEATSSTIRPDGWMHTGDIGKFDEEGWLYITDRSKELIKYKGLQVAPAELEALIGSLPYVKDVIVIPVLDEEAGELPRAYVVKQNDPKSMEVTAEEIVEYVKSKVAQHKRLRGGVVFTESIPKSPSGKLLRRVQIELDRKNIKK